MTKEEIIERFKTERTRIMSEMLDNPNRYGIYPTTKSYEASDKLYEECMEEYANQKQVNESKPCPYCGKKVITGRIKTDGDGFTDKC